MLMQSPVSLGKENNQLPFVIIYYFFKTVGGIIKIINLFQTLAEVQSIINLETLRNATLAQFCFWGEDV